MMTVISKETYLDAITKKYAYIESYIQLSNYISRYDINIAMENFCRDLLNLIYDYELINENAERKNAAGVDLIDCGNRIAIQVTSKTDSTKVRHSIDEFLERHLDKEYDRLLIMMLKSKLYGRDHNLKTILSNYIWSNSGISLPE